MNGTYFNGKRFVKADGFHRPVRAAPAVKKQPQPKPTNQPRGLPK